jgi:hypothetical protein
MNKLAVVLVSSILVTSVVTNLSAAPRGKGGPKTPLELLQEQQELLLRECKLTDEQQKTVKEKFKLKQDALEAWEKTNADKVKAAEEAAKTARQGTDANAKKQATATLKELAASRDQATTEADKAIQEALTEEQRMTWAGVQLAQTTLPRYKKANPTDDQTAKIKSACLTASKDLASFSGDDKKAKQGRATIQKSLQWAIDNVILTPEQRETVARKPAPKAAAQK